MAECERCGVSFLSGKGRGREKMSIFGMVFLMLPVMEKVFNLCGKNLEDGFIAITKNNAIFACLIENDYVYR